MKIYHKVFDVSPFEKCKIDSFSPLSVGWTQLPAPKEQRHWQKGKRVTSETVMRKLIAACPLSLGSLALGSQLACQEQRSMQGLWPQSSLQVTVA